MKTSRIGSIFDHLLPFNSFSPFDLCCVLPRFEKESLDIPTAFLSTMQRDINALDLTDPKPVEDQSLLINSGNLPSANLPSLNLSLGSSDPPPVPESFPRDPVPQSGRGIGWPYAPQGWPKLDDKWGWRVGKRASPSSLWIDRYVSVPTSLLKGRRAVEFASRKSLVEYCKQNFPQMTDPYNIFKAFDWKIPAPKDFKAPEPKEIKIPEKLGLTPKRDEPLPVDEDDNWLKSRKHCSAGNPDCILSKAEESTSTPLESLVCHICCSEPGFCRECKCILCCEFFRPNADDFSVIRCLNFPVPGQGICGHAAHLECAMNSQLAGVTKNGLEVEYTCRRCDMKTKFDRGC